MEKHYQVKKTGHKAEVLSYEISGDVDAYPLTFQYTNKEKYFIADQYCTNPECPCNDVTLSFIRLTNRKLKMPEFIVRLNLKSLSYEVERSSCDLEKISDIMKYILNKQEILETLKYRHH